MQPVQWIENQLPQEGEIVQIIHTSGRRYVVTLMGDEYVSVKYWTREKITPNFGVTFDPKFVRCWAKLLEEDD